MLPSNIDFSCLFFCTYHCDFLVQEGSSGMGAKPIRAKKPEDSAQPIRDVAARRADALEAGKPVNHDVQPWLLFDGRICQWPTTLFKAVEAETEGMSYSRVCSAAYGWAYHQQCHCRSAILMMCIVYRLYCNDWPFCHLFVWCLHANSLPLLSFPCFLFGDLPVFQRQHSPGWLHQPRTMLRELFYLSGSCCKDGLQLICASMACSLCSSAILHDDIRRFGIRHCIIQEPHNAGNHDPIQATYEIGLARSLSWTSTRVCRDHKCV